MSKNQKKGVREKKTCSVLLCGPYVCMRESHEVYRLCIANDEVRQHKRMHVCAFCANGGKQIYMYKHRQMTNMIWSYHGRDLISGPFCYVLGVRAHTNTHKTLNVDQSMFLSKEPFQWAFIAVSNCLL